MDDAVPAAAPDEVQASTTEALEPEPPRLDPQMEAFDDADPLRLAATTLSGDMRDFVLNLLDVHRSKEPMARRPEAEQKKIIAEVTARCREMVEEACRIIAVQGGATLTGTLEKVDVKGALKATITMSKTDPSRYKLIDAQGGDVLVALVDSRRFMGERAPAHVVPDQSDIETYSREVAEANDRARGEPADDGEVQLVPPEAVPGALGAPAGEVGWVDGAEEQQAEEEAEAAAADETQAPLYEPSVVGRGRKPPKTPAARKDRAAKAGAQPKKRAAKSDAAAAAH